MANQDKKINGLPLEVVDYLKQLEKAVGNHTLLSATNLVGRGAIVRVNKKFMDVSGYTEEELLGKDHKIINSGYHHSDFFKPIYDNAKRGVDTHLVIKNRSKDGSYYWVDSLFSPLYDKNKDVVGILALRHEVTDMKRNEEELEKKNILLAGEKKDAETELERQKAKDKTDLQKIAVYGLIGLGGALIFLMGIVLIKNSEGSQAVVTSGFIVLGQIIGVFGIIFGVKKLGSKDDE